ncbi:MAG: maltooligosyltrehalose trehalohydrolase [Thermomicrobiales bacterium]|nr:maltooligosyltrehalose trehalohydrolase [Thermomicrobiales bacterium]
MSRTTLSRPLGATITTEGVSFAVWAPKAELVEVELQSSDGAEYHPLTRDEKGVHSGTVPAIGAGARYRYRLDGGDSYPDPASRFQPEGVHGPSEVVDPTAFSWTDGGWPGLTMDGLVIYELHIGTYTPEGSYAALIGELPELKRLGVTAIELMPVADFPGRRNWGYDGVDLYAPSRAYGRPDDLRQLVDAAHRVGLGVILDVVYNHFGPDGNYLRQFSDDYFTARHQTPWGEAINYDGPNSELVREFVVANAIQWIQDYHFDGLRLDATDTIVDDSPTHILAELSDRVRAAAERNVVLIAEEARNSVRTVRPRDQGGYGIDAVWADDFHHELRVYLTGARENYYADYSGSMEEIAKAIEEGFVYQGQTSTASGKPRGTKVTDEPATAFVFCIQNHDQVGNRPFGERLHHEIDPGRYAVASTLLLFAPEPPLLFMGQEFAASTPFLFFTDHNEELGRLVTEGRRSEFGGFRAFADEDMRESIPDPQAESTFLSSKLKLRERRTNAGIYALYRALLQLRGEDPVLAISDRTSVRAEALGAQALAVHRWQGDEHRLLIANFGAATSLPIGEIPILRDVPDGRWRLVLSTANRRFGGTGERAWVRGRGREARVEVPARTAAIFAVKQ